MDSLHASQAYMMKEAGWSKTTASLLYNCQQDFNPKLIAQAARALKIRPFELLMHPEEAMALRRLRESALSIAAEHRLAYKPAPEEPVPPLRKLS